MAPEEPQPIQNDAPVFYNDAPVLKVNRAVSAHLTSKGLDLSTNHVRVNSIFYDFRDGTLSASGSIRAREARRQYPSNLAGSQSEVDV